MVVTARCVSWEDFTRLSRDAEMAIYEIDDSDMAFRVYAIKENIFVYEEPLLFPAKTEIVEDKRRHRAKTSRNAVNKTEQSRFTIISRQAITKTLRCGLSYSVTPRLVKEDNRWIAEFRYKFEPSAVSKFLSLALATPIDRVVEGTLPKVAQLVQ
jgi:hypothetical protein